jgi:anti-anti-sigma regulatory factor
VGVNAGQSNSRVQTLSIAGKAEAADGVRLRLAGKMTANSLGEVRREIGEARRRQKNVVLDLSEVTLVDRTSVGFLTSIVNGSVRLENCPQYLTRWLARK